MGKFADEYDRVRKALAHARRPAVLWSGGKDSTVLMHIAREIRPDIEAIQWRLPWIRAKWRYHESLAARWGVAIHDQLPAWSALCHGNGRVDVMEAYQIGDDCMVIARGTEPFDERWPWVCGLEWLTRPKAASTDFPWDVLLCGHKSGDEDPCSGPVPLQTDAVRLAGCAEVHYPLRWMTDEEIADYLVEFNIPWDTARYGMKDKRIYTLPDKHLNSDYYHACMRCIDKREGKFVVCPKTGLEVDNISGRCQEYTPRHEYCALRVGEPERDGGDQGDINDKAQRWD